MRRGTVSTLPRPGDVLADKYRLEAELGRGGMGAVFRARHLVTGKQVAIKCQLPSQQNDADDLARFLAEARAAVAVSHPNIVDVYDVDEANGALFLVMEYLDGVPLSALLGRGPLPIGPAVRTMLGAMRGIQAAHRSGVVHRDLKPHNVFLRRDGEGRALDPKLLDFGIAKLRSAGSASVSGSLPALTESGVVMGTVHYMSPEQAEDPRHVDARADIYALGVMFYELLGGRRPFEGDSLTAVLLRAARGQCVPLRSLRPELPPALAAAIAKAMSPRAADRFEHVGAFIDAVQPFAAEQGLRSDDAPAALGLVPVDVGEGARTGTRGSKALWLMVALVVIAGGLLGLRAWRERDAETAAAREGGAGGEHTALSPSPSPATTATAGAGGEPGQGLRPLASGAAGSMAPAAAAGPREHPSARRAPVAPPPPSGQAPTSPGRLRVDLAHDQF